jgi:dienelactone hydrolase
MIRFWGGVVAACAALQLSGCATPAESITERIRALGFSQSVVAGTPYRHLLAQAGRPNQPGPMHVYVEHDGLPWERPQRVSADPTPRNALALELMARDDGYRVYLGRPCYFGLHADPGCSPRLWTDARYSAEVVRSMAAVVNRIVDGRRGSDGVVLVGYSGGGTIAWLMAPHVPAATAVVTVAANLDVGAWTTLHHYSPLTGSLDPATEPPLPPVTRQVHLVGGQDSNVPPFIVHSVVARQPNAKVLEIGEFDHVCCWLDRWSALMRSAEMRRP